MSQSKDSFTKDFTFLNYENSDHSASHRRAVKSHISSKYRTGVRLQTKSRYALPNKSRRADEGNSKSKSLQKISSSLVLPALSPQPQQTPSPSPLEIGFRGIRVDPFQSLPGQETSCVPHALDYYTQVMSPMMDPLLRAVNVANPLTAWMFPLMLANEGAYHGGIALSQAYLENMRMPGARPSTETLYHRRKAVLSLRERLRNCDGTPDDGVLVSALALAAISVVYREDSISNRKGLALITAMKGGLDNLGVNGLLKAFLTSFDYFWMLQTGTESCFPSVKRRSLDLYPKKPFDNQVLSLIVTLPSGFAAVARQGNLGVDVIGILSRVSSFLRSKFREGKQNAQEQYPVLDSSGNYPDLITICSSLHSSPSTEHSLEKNLILAIILFVFDSQVRTGSMSRIPTYGGSRQELARSLPQAQPRTPAENLCSIWIWMSMLRSLSLEAVVAPHTVALWQIFFATFAEAGSWTTISAVMRQFFWHEALEDGFKRSWLFGYSVYTTGSTLSSGAAVIRTDFMRPGHIRASPDSSIVTDTENEGDEERGREESRRRMPRMMTLETYLEDVR